jgi:transcriptional regulator with XRE-family HTH domain
MNQEKIGKFIKKIREENHQTQKEFADKYNVSFQAVSKWENGKNIPDISLLKQICNDNNVSLDELLDNEISSKDNSKKNNKKKFFILIFIIILIIIFATIFKLCYKEDNNFEFKKISSSCSNFNITGSAAYNKDKTSIYISNIEFCGNDENTKYKKIEYVLYENHDNINTKISSGKEKADLTLVEYLKDLRINVDNYSQSCKTYTNSELYIEINAYDENDKITTYKIPLLLEENCE